MTSKEIFEKAKIYLENEYTSTCMVFESKEKFYKDLIEVSGGKEKWINSKIDRIYAVTMFCELTLDIDNYSELLNYYHFYNRKLLDLLTEEE